MSNTDQKLVDETLIENSLSNLDLSKTTEIVSEQSKSTEIVSEPNIPDSDPDSLVKEIYSVFLEMPDCNQKLKLIGKLRKNNSLICDKFLRYLVRAENICQVRNSILSQ